MALGARYGQVLRMVLQRSLLWVFGGLAVGLGLALSARRITGQLIAGVSGADPLTCLAAVLSFALIVVIASFVPARRASRVDPVQALRHE
jgi:putative ABC transport system permease protein